MLSFKRIITLTAGVAAGLSALAGAAQAQELTGAGATFPAPLYQRWFQEYGQSHGVRINYQPIGSGGGIKQITARAVDFGASDAPMNATELAAAPGIVHIPTVAGPVCVAYNIPGVGPGIHLTGPVIADIFLGKITRWNDSRITSLSPGTRFPATNIFVAHRSDGSGTTNIFTTYLSEVSSGWRDDVGAGKSVRWPVGLGGKGNAGVAQLIKANEGGIGYIELNYAVTNSIPYAAVRNRAGRFVYPNVEDTSEAVDGVSLPADFRKVAVNTSAPNGYPITGFTFLLVYRNGTKTAMKQFLEWALTSGQSIAPSMQYAPLPPGVRRRALAAVASIH
ncbi:MAG: phosphate ABC transporter substrate-binding protein PstS [Armatimonadetes bacterium]|nr:phosphate ABC transporter substrate-binding protein PstS [Armatimonadota bacterium]